MCGLFGSIGFSPDVARIDVVSHRGPDGRGWREFASAAGPVALGHRRLAIIDVSDAGLQPMADRSGRYHLVFNGEIYNYIELRDEMRAMGEAFETASDSEVLLRAYMLWGEGAMKRLRGMFAFLVWDDRDKILFAARDRYGIKPLYVTACRQGVAFASEIKQLLDLVGSSRRVNLARAYDFLADGVSDHTAETLFEGILQIRGGEYAVVNASTAAILPPIVRRWHEIAMSPAIPISEKDAAERLRELLRESVCLHLRADVSVGSCLSGGLDSSSIVCLMASIMPPGGQGLHTVSACYADKSVDEKPFMDTVIEKTNARAHFVFPRAEDVFQLAADITWHQDEPFGSTSIFAQWCVFEKAKAAGIKVMLDGQGADEILAGYHGLFPTYLAEMARSRRLMQLARTMVERRTVHRQSFGMQSMGLVYSLAPDRLKRLIRGARRDRPQYDWLSTDALSSLGQLPSALETAAASLGVKTPDDIASMCLVMAHSSNLPMLLHWEDRNSMAHGIEARVPFLDHPVVDFALGLGSQHKLVGADTKMVLRRAMADILPPAVSARRDKLGFATPEAAWFRGPLRQLVEDGVERTLRTLHGLLDPTGTRHLASKMLSGNAPLDFSLWRIISLGIWAERFKISLG